MGESPLKAILFDLDDTLVPEMASEREALLVVCGLASEKYSVDPTEMADAVDRAARKLWAQWSNPATYSSIAYSGWEGLWGPPDLPDDGLGNDHETLARYKRDAWDDVLGSFSISDQNLRDELIERHRIERISRLVPLPEGESVLRELSANFPLAIVTNGAPNTQRFKLEKAGLSDYFTVFVASGDVGIGKPDPLPFKSALGQLDVEPVEAIMIGNSYSSDVQGAASVGVRSIWFNADEAPRPETGSEPTYEIKSLNEIPGIIRQISS